MISILGGASILVVSYLVLVRGSNEHRESLLRVKALNRFLHEMEEFQIEHGCKNECEWDEKVNSFRSNLEKTLGNQSGSLTISSESASTDSSREEGVGATNPVQ